MAGFVDEGDRCATIGPELDRCQGRWCCGQSPDALMRDPQHVRKHGDDRLAMTGDHDRASRCCGPSKSSQHTSLKLGMRLTVGSCIAGVVAESQELLRKAGGELA